MSIVRRSHIPRGLRKWMHSGKPFPVQIKAKRRRLTIDHGILNLFTSTYDDVVFYFHAS